jgi:hypothetical protein
MAGGGEEMRRENGRGGNGQGENGQALEEEIARH